MFPQLLYWYELNFILYNADHFVEEADKKLPIIHPHLQRFCFFKSDTATYPSNWANKNMYF